MTTNSRLVFSKWYLKILNCFCNPRKERVAELYRYLTMFTIFFSFFLVQKSPWKTSLRTDIFNSFCCYELKHPMHNGNGSEKVCIINAKQITSTTYPNWCVNKRLMNDLLICIKHPKRFCFYFLSKITYQFDIFRIETLRKVSQIRELCKAYDSFLNL